MSGQPERKGDADGHDEEGEEAEGEVLSLPGGDRYQSLGVVRTQIYNTYFVLSFLMSAEFN